MRPLLVLALLIPCSAAVTSCGGFGPDLPEVPVETRFAFTNFSRQFYAVLDVREHGATQASGQTAPFVKTPLLAPGATHRIDFTDLLGNACPDALDFQLFLYRRVNDDLPIGLDDGEVVDPTPIVAGLIQNIPACNVQSLVTYTVVNWDAPEGTARVKIAQGSLIESSLASSGRFPNVDVAWEIQGVDPSLADEPPPAHAPVESIAGRVTLTDGTGVNNVGVLVRTRFRVRLDDNDPANDPDAGFGDPIAFTITGDDGIFSIDRPAGAYRIEFFSDDFSFRPAIMDLETPITVIRVIVEPL
jgi:hypothetical protein